MKSLSMKDLTILVVDDNATNRRILAAQLDRWGCKCELANDGPSSIEMLRNAPAKYAAVIMDMQMPKMNGVETTRRIRDDLGYESLPIILLSSLGSLRSQEELREAGFSGGLTKPARPNRLYNSILVALNKAGGNSGPSAPAEVKRTEAPTILLVEDNPVNRMVAERVLGKMGYTVHTAVDGSEAIPMVKAKRYDVILMDIQMPKMDGFSATAAIRDLPADIGRNIPIVAMTANAMEGDKERCLAAGMDDYISKPFTQDQLQHVLDRWCRKAA